MADTTRLNNLLIKLAENDSKLLVCQIWYCLLHVCDITVQEIPSEDGRSIVNCNIGTFDEQVLKRILVAKQLVNNKSEQSFVSY